MRKMIVSQELRSYDGMNAAFSLTIEGRTRGNLLNADFESILPALQSNGNC